MLFEDALKLMREGKKVRRNCWGIESDYIFLIKDKKSVLDDEGKTYFIDRIDVFADDWEEFKEPYTREVTEIFTPDNTLIFQASEFKVGSDFLCMNDVLSIDLIKVNVIIFEQDEKKFKYKKVD